MLILKKKTKENKLVSEIGLKPGIGVALHGANENVGVKP